MQPRLGKKKNNLYKEEIFFFKKTEFSDLSQDYLKTSPQNC